MMLPDNIPTNVYELCDKWGMKPYCGCDLPPGWIPLVDNLCDQLHKLDFDFSLVSQIKEKFAGLRFYIDDVDERFDKLITAAEHLSERTCEECGKPGKQDTFGGWMNTFCEEHWTRLKNDTKRED